MVGFYAFSKAGHEKNRLYLIIGEDEDMVYLIDGVHRKIENPKKKKKKHIQIMKQYQIPDVKKRLENGEEDFIYAMIQEVKNVKGRCD